MIDCTITAPDVVCSESTGNAASTAEPEAAYAWSITNGTITSAKNTKSIKFTADSSGPIRLTVRVTTGGRREECYKDIAVNPDCSWTSNASVYNGTPVQFTGPAGMSSYRWDFGDGQRSSSKNPSHLYSAPGTYEVNLTVTGCGKARTCPGTVEIRETPRAYGCYLDWQKCLGGSKDDIAYSIQQTADEGYVIAGYTYSNDGNVSGHHKDRDYWVVNLGVINCTITAPDKVCPGSAGNVASAGESGAAYYAWSITNGTITSPSDQQSISFTAGSSGTARLTVRVTVTSQSQECYYDERQKDIKIRPLDCNWTSNSPVCKDAEVRFKGPAGMDSYHWNFGDGEVSRERDPKHLYRSLGIYTVNLTVTSCGSSKTCTGRVESRPILDCNWTSNAPVCDGTPVRFTGPAGMSSYRWDFGDGQASSTKDPSHLYSDAGNYTVKLTATQGRCTESCAKKVEVRTSAACGRCIEWERCLGGSKDEHAQSVQQTADGGYIAAGYTQSNGGNVSGNHGGKDFWIVKLEPSGKLDWQKCLGGSKDDYAMDVRQTADGGYVVAGLTNSSDKDVSGNHGGKDFWIVKLEPSGKLDWQECLGGSGDDEASSVRQTADGGYVVAGWTNSRNGNVRGNHREKDYWVVKLDASGKLDWQKCLGGTRDDYAQSVQQTADGGYVVAGFTASNDGDVSGKHDGFDFWIVKLDNSSNLVWQKCLGGRLGDQAWSIRQTADGGYVVAGNAASPDGDVSGKHGSLNYSDYWVVKLDPSGNKIWQKCLGGSYNDEARSVQQTTDGGYVVAGYAYSNDGNVSGNLGRFDFWYVFSWLGLTSASGSR